MSAALSKPTVDVELGIKNVDSGDAAPRRDSVAASRVDKLKAIVFVLGTAVSVRC